MPKYLISYRKTEETGQKPEWAAFTCESELAMEAHAIKERVQKRMGRDRPSQDGDQGDGADAGSSRRDVRATGRRTPAARYVHNVATGHDRCVNGTPDAAAFEIAGLMGSMQTIWHVTADGWNERTSTIRQNFAANGDAPALAAGTATRSAAAA